jgi:CRISPR-associated protein Csb2
MFWPDSELDNETRDDLAKILNMFPYLGRAESWCAAELLSSPPGMANCYPLQPGKKLEPTEETVRILAASEPLNFEALFSETSDLREKKSDLMNPPGTRWVYYVRPANSFSPKYVQHNKYHLPKVTIARYILDGSVLPLLTDAIKIGDLARKAAMSQYGRLYGGNKSMILSGKDDEGHPLHGHRHASYIPTDEDGDGWIDHLTIWAPAGFDEKEQEALAGMRTLKMKGRPEIRLVLQGMGTPDDFNIPLFEKAALWKSITPFVTIRHPKQKKVSEGNKSVKKWVDTPQDQIRLELTRRGFPEPIEITPLPRALLRSRSIPWLAFYRWRSKDTPAGGQAYGFIIRFEKPIQGPIALGYGAHFGLGLFIPIPDNNQKMNAKK